MNIAEVKEQAVLAALACVGLKYSQPKRLQKDYRDCSSLVARAFGAAGYEWGCNGRPVPRSLEEVYEDGFELLWPASYADIGKKLPTTKSIRVSADPQRGDLLFAATKGTASTRKNKIEHVVMLTSPTRIVHARGTAYGVREDNVSLYDAKICALTRFNPACDLVRGHIGNRVKALQTALNKAGAALAIDRDFGPATEAAVKKFQSVNGLPVTGRGDAATRKALGITEDWTTTRPTLKRGSSGNYVKELQTLLNKVGGYSLEVDGDFGPLTNAALLDYQAKQGINDDEVCGPVTWAHLLGETDDGEKPAEDDFYIKVIAAKSANVRVAPGTGAKSRGIVLKGAILRATGSVKVIDGTKWYNVIYDGESCWISGKMAELHAGSVETPDENAPVAYEVKGKIPDISKWNGKINFAKMAAEADFVIARGLCRITKDVMIDTYAKDMTQNKIPFGVYNFTYAATIAEAKRDAKLFFEATQEYKPLYYVLDAEVSSVTKEIIVAWIETIRSLTSAPVGCYVAHHMYAKYKYKEIAHLLDFTWVPRYGKNSGAPETKPSYPCDLWQFTSMGKIAGIPGRVDLNMIIGQGKNVEWFRGEK
jgi:peptidoglycan hydrolase-like protein with peptidoglycan-binding domain